MLCTNCKKREATHTVCGNDGEEMHLCDGCFERLGGAAAYLGDGPDFFVNFLPPEKDDALKCPVCGTTLSDYTRTGLVGCAACYDTFREELMPVIRRIHGRTQHEGKRPLGSGKLFELFDRVVGAVLLNKADKRVQQYDKEQNARIHELVLIARNERGDRRDRRRTDEQDRHKVGKLRQKKA